MSAGAVARAERREWIGLAVLALPCAVAIGDRLPTRLGADVIDVGRTAVTHALRLDALGAALIATLLAVFAAFSLRGIGRSEGGEVPKAAAAPRGCE